MERSFQDAERNVQSESGIEGVFEESGSMLRVTQSALFGERPSNQRDGNQGDGDMKEAQDPRDSQRLRGSTVREGRVLLP